MLLTEGEEQEAGEKQRGETKPHTNEKVPLGPSGISVPFLRGLEANSALSGFSSVG